MSDQNERSARLCTSCESTLVHAKGLCVKCYNRARSKPAKSPAVTESSNTPTKTAIGLDRLDAVIEVKA